MHPVVSSMDGHFSAHQVSSSLSLSLLLLLSPTSRLDLTSDDQYRYFIDNQRVSDHRSVVFGIREVNHTEQHRFCSGKSTISNSNNNTLPDLFDTPMIFSSDYELRSFTSGCYYLDSNNDWRSDGVTVSETRSLLSPFVHTDIR